MSRDSQALLLRDSTMTRITFSKLCPLYVDPVAYQRSIGDESGSILSFMECYRSS